MRESYHRLFTAADTASSSAGRSNKNDIRWALNMDVAIASAILAMHCGLGAKEARRRQSIFISHMPEPHSPEQMSSEAHTYYQNHAPPEDGTWGLRDISDYIFALAHRQYAFEYNADFWLNSRFKAIPVGLPRTRNRTRKARNYTPHKASAYSAYRSRLSMGKTFEKPTIITRTLNGWMQLDNEIDPIELTETDDQNWLHTRISTLPSIWALLENLFHSAMNIDTSTPSRDCLTTTLDITAQIHWWYSHAMPYRRGSAAIADMLTKTIFQYHDITTPRWRHGISPDIEAFCRPLTDFVEAYPNFFISRPLFVNQQLQTSAKARGLP